MPSYEYSLKHKAYVKQCSHCKTFTVGTTDHDESVKIFQKTFSPASDKESAADYMQSRCWVCNSHRRRLLGVTLEMLRDMHEAQDGCCAICNIPISLDRCARNPANVDHDDNIGKVRDLLCGNCNRGIGLFFHNEDFLISAAAYCKKHKEPAGG